MSSLATGQRNTNAFCQFLQLCPNLEALQLHWYGTYRPWDLTQALVEEKRFFDRVADFCRFPSLERLTLKGIYTSEAALISFLRQTRLRSLDMEEIHLYLTDHDTTDTFRPVFDYLVGHSERLEHVHFDNLFEADRLIFFNNAPGHPHFPHSAGPNGPNVITRTGADARKPIEYHLRIGWGGLPGSPYVHEQRMKRQLEYGPSRY